MPDPVTDLAARRDARRARHRDDGPLESLVRHELLRLRRRARNRSLAGPPAPPHPDDAPEARPPTAA